MKATKHVAELDCITSETSEEEKVRQVQSKATLSWRQLMELENVAKVASRKSKPFNINVEMRGLDGKIIGSKNAMIDTGADISLLDADIAEKLPLTMYPSDAFIAGVGSEKLQGVFGFVYLTIGVKDSDVTYMVKAYVVDNLSGGLLLGENFLNSVHINMDSEFGTKTIYMKWKGLTWVNPTLTLEATLSDTLDKVVREVEKEMGHSHPLPMLKFSGTDEQPTVFSQGKELGVKRVRLAKKVPEDYERWPQRKQLEFMINQQLTLPQRNEAMDLLWEYRKVFSRDENDLGLIPHEWTNIKIELDGDVPFKRAYDVSPVKRLEFEKTILPLLGAGIIEESTDHGGVPALLIPKPNGTNRLVVDYRPLNAKCRKIEYPMPSIDSCLQALAGKKFFFVVDLAQGYHQLGIAPEERRKTVFLTPDRKLRYTRLPMGYVNAPYHFQKLINEMIEGLQYANCIGYFDDLIAFGETWTEFMANMKLLLDRLKQYGIKAKPQKCSLGDSEVKFLGHIVNRFGIKPNPSKVEALKALVYPSNKKQLRSMLGTFTFFSRYIPQFAIKAQPLFELTVNEATFKLQPEHRKAIDELKEALVEDCLLNHFRPELPTKLSCDASDKAIGGVLMQQEILINEATGEEEKSWRPVAYYSQVLLKYQKNYTVSEKELLGILIGIIKFRKYLEGIEFLVETDHHALCQITKVEFKNGRLNRWSLLLQGFNYQVIYRNGESHVSDCFSRMSEWDHRKPIILEDDAEELLTVNIINDVWEPSSLEMRIVRRMYELEEPDVGDVFLEKINQALDMVTGEPELMEETAKNQRENEKYASIIRDLQRKDGEMENDPRELKLYSLKRGVLYRLPIHGFGRRLVLTKKMFRDLFRYEHDAPEGGHFGTRKTYERLRQHYWMPNMYDVVFKACRKCSVSAIHKVANFKYNEAQLKGIARTPGERWEVDVQGPFKRSNKGNTCIMVATDSLTRYTCATATRNQETTEVIKFLKEIFYTFGYPKVVQTDQGTNFMSDLFAEFMMRHNIAHYISNAYHPQGQGQVERMNRVIGERVRIFCDGKHKSWDEPLPEIVFGINNAIHSITKYTPAYLLLGFSPRKSSDQKFLITPCSTDVYLARAQAYERLVEAQRKTKERLENAGKASNYQPGDLVLIRKKAVDLVLGKKLTKPYHGPYLVLEHVRGHVKTLSLVETNFGSANAFNVDLTKPFKGTLSDEQRRMLLELCDKHKLATPVQWDDDDKNDDENNETQTIESMVSDDNPIMGKEIVGESIQRRRKLKGKSFVDPQIPETLEKRYHLRPRTVKIRRLIRLTSGKETVSLLSDDQIERERTTEKHSSHYCKVDVSKVEETKFSQVADSIFNFVSCDKVFGRLKELDFMVSQCHDFKGIAAASGTAQCSFFKGGSKSTSSAIKEYKEANSHLGLCHFVFERAVEQLIVPSISSINCFILIVINRCNIYIAIMAQPPQQPAKKPASECSAIGLVDRLHASEKREKEAFKRLVFEKIGETMIAFDVVKRFSHLWPQPPHGFQRWHLYHAELPKFIDKFICHMCAQFAKTPVACNKCRWVYCKECAVYLNRLHPILCNGEELASSRQFLCFNINCPIGAQPEISLMSAEDMALYNQVLFRCRHVLCCLVSTPAVIFSHEESCPLGPIDWSFDTTLVAHHYDGEYLKEYMKQHPVNWRTICSPAIRRNEFFQFQLDETRKKVARVWLLTVYPNMSRTSLSSQLDIGFGWKDAVRQAKYNDGVLSASEQIVQKEWGLPAYKPTPEELRMNIPPLDPKYHPTYDPVTKKLVFPPLEKQVVTPVKFRPREAEKQTLAKIAEEYGPEARARREQPDEPMSDSSHLQRYLGEGKALKRKHSSPCKENREEVDINQPSTSSGITQPRYQPKPVMRSKVVIPSKGMSKYSDSFQKPSAPPPTASINRHIQWADQVRQDNRGSRSNSVSSNGSNASVMSGDRHAERWFRPNEKKPLIRVPIWDNFSQRKKIMMETALKNLSEFMGNHAPKCQALSDKRDETQRCLRARSRNAHFVRIFERRPAPNIVELEDARLKREIEASQQSIAREGQTVLAIAMICEVEYNQEEERLLPQPIWIVIMDHNFQVVYESLVKSSANPLHSDYHGLTREMLTQQRPLKVIASQVAEYLAGCDIIVGAGIHNHLRALGFCDRSIRRFECRFRDMTVHFSPRRHQATSLCINALLYFEQRLVEPLRPHPEESAHCSMRLYLAERKIIEAKAEVGGLSFRNQHTKANHPTTSNRVTTKYPLESDWPQEWKTIRWPHRITFPAPQDGNPTSSLDDVVVIHFEPRGDGENSSDVDSTEFFVYLDGLQADDDAEIPDPMREVYANDGNHQPMNDNEEEEMQVNPSPQEQAPKEDLIPQEGEAQRGEEVPQVEEVSQEQEVRQNENVPQANSSIQEDAPHEDAPQEEESPQVEEPPQVEEAPQPEEASVENEPPQGEVEVLANQENQDQEERNLEPVDYLPVPRDNPMFPHDPDEQPRNEEEQENEWNILDIFGPSDDDGEGDAGEPYQYDPAREQDRERRRRLGISLDGLPAVVLENRPEHGCLPQ